VKSFLKLFIACLLARSRRRPIELAIITRIGTFYYTRNIVHYIGYCITTVDHVDVSCMHSHGCCIQTVCMNGTFQRKNVISDSIDVMRRNTDTEISKLETVSIAEPLQNRQHAQNR